MSNGDKIDGAIVELLGGIARQFRGELRQASESVGGKVTPFQHEIIAYIGRTPGTGVMSLADLAGRDKAQVTRIIAELEALNLITRERSEADRRATRLSLTKSGESLFHQMLEKRSSLAAAMLNALDPNERQALHGMLVKMRSGLAEAKQEP